MNAQHYIRFKAIYTMAITALLVSSCSQLPSSISIATRGYVDSNVENKVDSSMEKYQTTFGEDMQQIQSLLDELSGWKTISEQSQKDNRESLIAMQGRVNEVSQQQVTVQTTQAATSDSLTAIRGQVSRMISGMSLAKEDVKELRRKIGSLETLMAKYSKESIKTLRDALDFYIKNQQDE